MIQAYVELRASGRVLDVWDAGGVEVFPRKFELGGLVH